MPENKGRRSFLIADFSGQQKPGCPLEKRAADRRAFDLPGSPSSAERRVGILIFLCVLCASSVFSVLSLITYSQEAFAVPALSVMMRRTK